MERVTLQELIRQASDLGDDSEPIPYQGVLLVTAAEKRVDKRGKFYLAMTLQDRTGSIN